MKPKATHNTVSFVEPLKTQRPQETFPYSLLRAMAKDKFS